MDWEVFHQGIFILKSKLTVILLLFIDSISLEYMSIVKPETSTIENILDLPKPFTLIVVGQKSLLNYLSFFQYLLRNLLLRFKYFSLISKFFSTPYQTWKSCALINIELFFLKVSKFFLFQFLKVFSHWFRSLSFFSLRFFQPPSIINTLALMHWLLSHACWSLRSRGEANIMTRQVMNRSWGTAPISITLLSWYNLTLLNAPYKIPPVTYLRSYSLPNLIIYCHHFILSLWIWLSWLSRKSDIRKTLVQS